MNSKIHIARETLVVCKFGLFLEYEHPRIRVCCCMCIHIKTEYVNKANEYCFLLVIYLGNMNVEVSLLTLVCDEVGMIHSFFVPTCLSY